MMEIIHLCPEGDNSTTQCCGWWVNELSWRDRITIQRKLVTCKGREYYAGYRHGREVGYQEGVDDFR